FLNKNTRSAPERQGRQRCFLSGVERQVRGCEKSLWPIFVEIRPIFECEENGRIFRNRFNSNATRPFYGKRTKVASDVKSLCVRGTAACEVIEGPSGATIVEGRVEHYVLEYLT